MTPSNKKILGLCITVLVSLPFFMMLPLATYVILGAILGGITCVLYEHIVRKQLGKGIVDAGFERALEKTEDAESKIAMELEEEKLKKMTGIVLFVFLIGYYMALWPGAVFYDLLIYTFPTLSSSVDDKI